MAGEGLERLGYYNGQRLEALDYRLEQRYHIDARRMLNRGLFTPGVVSGFLVEKVAGETRKVRVRQGVALDPVGREVILLDDVPFGVPNQAPTEGPGYLLIARYSEETVEGGDAWCSSPTGAPRPARVREEVVLTWCEHAPDHRRCQSGGEGLDCGVLLALVTLTPSCELDAIFTGVREYARPTHISQVQPFSFEGEKDIDKDNPKRLRFNINGVPASVRLYLWGDRFSTLYYTELGQHTHSFDTWPATPLAKRLTDPAGAVDDHKHELPDGSGNTSNFTHHHQIRPDKGGSSGGFVQVTSASSFGTFGPVHYDDGDPRATYIGDTPHDHTVAVHFDEHTGEPIDKKPLHQHGIPDTSPFGATDAIAHARGPHKTAYAYLKDLRVSLRVGLVSTDITKEILDRLPMSWTSLGKGNPNDPLNTEGTGEIDLLAIANEKKIDLSLPNTYELTFSVADGGGKVAYNLFVA
jgi:hypothetical protein